MKHPQFTLFPRASYTNHISIGNELITLEHAIKTAFWRRGKIIVLFDRLDNPGLSRNLSNLVAIDLKGQILWRCELPDSQSEDCVEEILSRTWWPSKHLKVATWQHHWLKIDVDTGKIVGSSGPTSPWS